MIADMMETMQVMTANSIENMLLTWCRLMSD